VPSDCLLLSDNWSAVGLVGVLNGSVELPCLHHQLPGPIEEIDVYWQMKKEPNPLVVAVALHGKVDPTHVSEIFRGRSHLNPNGLHAGNFNLRLNNLSLHDRGTYQCIILWSPSFTSNISETTVELEVTAEFSIPVVETPSLRNLQHGQELTLNCTSKGGLEEPRIAWINAHDGKEVPDGHIRQYVLWDGDLINVTSTITLNITSNISIQCVIITRNGNLTSLTWKVEAREKETSGPGVLAVSLITGGLVAVLLTVVVVRWRHMHHVPSYEAPTTQMSDLQRG
ncbi:ICOS ligand-like, partial [Engystomops pustulosus]|uniref:ICOS ligand-like n=1 Tax=Engystomops pustulosus TaxID=76066 RepID=UPI003AFB6D6A